MMIWASPCSTDVGTLVVMLAMGSVLRAYAECLCSRAGLFL